MRAQYRRALAWTGLASWLAVTMALSSLLRVLVPGAWFGLAVATAAVMFAIGFLARQVRWIRPLGPLIQFAVLVFGFTATIGRDSALLFIFPSNQTLKTVPALVVVAATEIREGVAPLDPSVALTFVIVAATGILAIVMDILVVSAKLPLIAGVGLFGVWLIPAISVPRTVDIVSFVGFAIALLMMFHAVTAIRLFADRTRATVVDGSASPMPNRAASATLLAWAAGLGAVAIVVSLLVAPNLSLGAVRQGASGTPTASLNLGNALRQPEPTEVLTLTSTADASPYLRVATLSNFDGITWHPDKPRRVPASEGFVPPILDEASEIAGQEQNTRIQVQQLNAGWAPTPYLATAVTGLEGDWQIAADNSTVTSKSVTATGQDYTVTSYVAEPTREQLQATNADRSMADYTELPDEIPPLVAELAEQMTAGTTSDYDALIALQDWFRGPEFTYSLDAPVEQDFDGSGSEAVGRFLLVRSGYCVHYAAAFTLMARSLGMPTRIVIGYRPGESTGEVVDGEVQYQVTSAQLHSWPEVYFTGVGWVSFEPTKSLGRATSYRSEVEGATPTPTASPSTPTAAPTTAPSAGPDRADEALPEEAAAGGSAGGVSPAVWVGLVMLLLAAAPMLVGGGRRAGRRRAASGGDAVAAWRLIQETAIDLGIALPPGDSARSLGRRLITRYGADVPAMRTLVTAVEQTSYGPGGEQSSGDLAGAAATVRRDLFSAATRRRGLRAVLLPSSLLIRPGSAYAARGAAGAGGTGSAAVRLSG